MMINILILILKEDFLYLKFHMLHIFLLLLYLMLNYQMLLMMFNINVHFHYIIRFLIKYSFFIYNYYLFV